MKKASSLLKFIVNLSLSCLLAVTAYGATFEVGPSGYPYTSIQMAITAATNGDTVLVHDGIYVENINFSGKAITVRSANGAAGTIIDGNASGSVVTFNTGEGSGSILDGFTIRNGSGDSEGWGGGIYCILSSPTIINCTINGNTANSGGGIGFNNSSSPIITNCTISGNTALIGGGIQSRSSSPTITNCTINGNTGTWASGGIGVDWGSSASITNCIITGNTAGSGGGINGYTSSSTIINCTISGNTATVSGGGIYFDSADASLKNSILWGNVPNQWDRAATGGFSSLTYTDIDHEFGEMGNGNIRQDPLFVDPANGDFRLQPASPCIDAGTSEGAPSTDMDGFPRYDYPQVPNIGGGTYPYYDMGAHEYVGVAIPPEGTIGTKVTINGTGFGTKKGKVFINGIAAKIAKDGWGLDQITCTISKPPLPVDTAHPVSVMVNKVSTPLDGTFTLRGLVLDELLTNSGAYPEEITVTGKFFSTKKGKVYLYDPATDKKKNLRVTDWKMNESTGISELTFVVPKPSKAFPADLYQLKISNKIGPASTSPDFNVLEPGL
jgi:predicted outer membrane repeat protein